MRFTGLKATAAIAAGVLSLTAASMAGQAEKCVKGKWMSGDFHQHTLYTDGSTTFDFSMSRNSVFDLDWWANSEHGGARTYDGNRHFWDDPAYYAPGTILGDYRASGGHQVMYRWQSLRDFAWPDILRARKEHCGKSIVSGVEWNVPGHEHCSVGIIANDATAVSAFEFQFDKNDPDRSRTGELTPYGTLIKANGAGKPLGADRHADAVLACTWMRDQKDAGRVDDAWIIFAHIERAGPFRTGSSDGGYNVEHFRDFNTIAPDVCFGFEGAPGHQQNIDGRGGFGTGALGGTYGGAGFYTAKIGGLWDALLGEGRRWFNFASSDYHLHWTKGGDDYYPGEYQKTWSHVQDLDRDNKYSLTEIAASLRSGNSFHVMGDLVDQLQFEAKAGTVRTVMGGEMKIPAGINRLKIVIVFHSPKFNNYGDVPLVDHIDLIAGSITGKIDPNSPDYTKATNESARVIARFTAADWTSTDDGRNVISYTIPRIDNSTYFRLRGTNMAPNTPGETDADGNPLADIGAPTVGNEQAWKDLWFYGNPIYVYVE